MPDFEEKGGGRVASSCGETARGSKRSEDRGLDN